MSPRRGGRSRTRTGLPTRRAARIGPLWRTCATPDTRSSGGGPSKRRCLIRTTWRPVTSSGFVGPPRTGSFGLGRLHTRRSSLWRISRRLNCCAVPSRLVVADGSEDGGQPGHGARGSDQHCSGRAGSGSCGDQQLRRLEFLVNEAVGDGAVVDGAGCRAGVPTVAVGASRTGSRGGGVLHGLDEFQTWSLPRQDCPTVIPS